jgi:carbamoyltransferase
MAYNILGITPGHNGSAALISDGKLIFYLEEERLSKVKKDANPFRVILDIISKYQIDEIALAGAGKQSPNLIRTNENLYYGLVRKYYPKVKLTIFEDKHHLCHNSTAFFNSGFDSALGIVIDAQGSNFNYKNNIILETDSIYSCSYPNFFKTIYKNFLSNSYKEKNLDKTISPLFSIGKSYELISNYLGFIEEEGKTMGLSSYGKFNPSFKNLFINNYLNSELIMVNRRDPSNFTGIFSNPHNISEVDIAWKLQNDVQQIVGDYIEKYTKEINQTQVVCSGGFFLNCVSNYYLIKRFPNIKFYFEPISHDGGTSIGAAKLAWLEKTQDTTIRLQKTLYYGPKYSKEELLEGIKKYT